MLKFQTGLRQYTVGTIPHDVHQWDPILPGVPHDSFNSFYQYWLSPMEHSRHTINVVPIDRKPGKGGGGGTKKSQNKKCKLGSAGLLLSIPYPLLPAAFGRFEATFAILLDWPTNRR